MKLTEIQRVLESLGTRPRQSLGQNFLHDANIARWIVGRLGIQPGDHVVEIGPGLGALTGELAAHDVHLTLIEKDGRMVEWLREKFASDAVELFHIDALDFDLRLLQGKGPVKIIGNLPYYVSTPLIAKFTSALSPASMLVFTLQHEVAARLSASPGSKDFGAMTVCCARRWHIRYARKLSPAAFHPRPQVSSAVVVFERKLPRQIPPCNEGLFERIVRRGFSERRKQLRNLLSEYRPMWADLCARLGVPETVRGEELGLGQWEALVHQLDDQQPQRDEEVFDVVDENDHVVDSLPRRIVHVNNLRHRAVHVLIFSQHGELFLQKRSLWKDRNPGRWDSSAAGHLDAGESYRSAAVREIREEIGVDCPLERIGKLPCSAETGWEFVEVFRGRCDGPFQLAPLEVEVGAFFPMKQVRTWLARNPEDFSPVFALCMRLPEFAK